MPGSCQVLPENEATVCGRSAIPAPPWGVPASEPVTRSPSPVPGTQSLLSQCLVRGDERLQTTPPPASPWRESDF